VRLLRGSFEDWVEAGGSVDTEPVKVVQSSELKMGGNINNQDAKERSSDCSSGMPIDTIDLEGMKDAVLNPDGRTVILDARGSSFAAKGHMPGAIHVPYSSLTQKGTTIQFRQD
jgi:3-mercaptopyruvate sulfurtransferase SseA